MQQHEEQLIPGLHDELGLLILARTPRSRHPIMKLVSKSWNSTMSSDKLFTLRRSLGLTEQWLYFLFVDKQGNIFCTSLDPGGTWRSLPPIPSTPDQLAVRGFSLSTPDQLAVRGFSLAELDGCLYLFDSPVGPDLLSPLPRFDPASVWRYSPRTNRWTAVARMAAPSISCHTAAVHGRLYAVGDTAEVYSPVTNSWARIPDMTFPALPPGSSPEARWMVTLAGRLWVKQGAFGILDSCGGEVYDPVKNTWSVMPRGMGDADGCRSAEVEDGRLLWLDVLGHGRGSVLKEYDAEHDRWRVVAALSEPRGPPLDNTLRSVCAWNGEMYAVSGKHTVAVLRADCVRGEFVPVASRSFGRAKMTTCQAVGI